jgi:glycosyltransferase involved in cell wall biosynthesis
MQVSGFTILRNGVRYGYPFLESIQSILGLVDEFIVNLGDSDDGTLQALQALGSPKVRVVHNKWNPEMFFGGRILAQQTNLALEQCTGDWCFYLQADEVVHEDDLEPIERAMRRYLHAERVEGLSFRYLHFRGAYNVRDPLSYRRQVRIIRNAREIRSIHDACGFARHGRNLHAADSRGRVFHYGYVKPPEIMLHKGEAFARLYEAARAEYALPHTEDADERKLAEWVFGLKYCVPYNGPHPRVMRELIHRRDWDLPGYQPLPMWRNPAWWRKLVYKNTRTFRRWFGISHN